MDVTSGYAPVKDAQLYYEISGEGEPLVLVHSMLFNRKLWDDMVPLLAERYKVIRYDLRGYGKSPAEDLEGDDVEDLLALFDHLGIEKARLIGLSMGSGIAFEFTTRNENRVKALVMGASGVIGESSTEEFDKRWQEFRMAARRGDKAEAIDIFAELWVDAQGKAEPEVMARAKEIMGEYEFGIYILAGQREKEAAEAAEQPEASAASEESAAAPAEEEEDWEALFKKLLQNLEVPLLLVAGTRDQPGVIDSIRATADARPQSEVAIIDGAAHIIPLEKPAEFVSVVLEFFNRQEAAA